MYPEDAAGLHRSRSYGHGPAPGVHVYNQHFQENIDRERASFRNESYSPPYSAPFLAQPAIYGRDRSRSRSYSRAEEAAIVADYQRRKEREAEEQRQAIERYKVAEEAKIIADKEAKAAAIAKYKQELKDKEEEEKEAEARVRKKEAEEKLKKKKLDEEYEERVRHDLSKFGFRDNQVKAIVEGKKPEDIRHNPTSIAVIPTQHHPVYPKIKRKDISKETLAYYDLPWEYTSDSHEYIIILRELTERETDVLFEHTRRLRSRTLLSIEPVRGRDGLQNAWVRRRSKSKSGRDRSRGKSPGQIRLAEAVARGI